MLRINMNELPLQFIDTVQSRKHIILVHEEPEYARMIEFRFIGNGLSKGEHCIYVSNEDTTFIENEMGDAGIDVKSFKKKNLIHTFSITEPIKNEDRLKGVQQLWNRITADSKPPFRVVGRLFSELNTTDEILAAIDVEGYLQKAFDSFGCTLICPYNVADIEDVRRGRWLGELLKNHHGVIFAPKVGKGIAFYMR